MKANNLIGDYCQSCAAALDEVQRNHRRVIVLDSQCAQVYHQSGDAARLDEALGKGDPVAAKAAAHEPPEIPSHAAKQETAEVQETVHAKPAKPTHRPFKASRR